MTASPSRRAGWAAGVPAAAGLDGVVAMLATALGGGAAAAAAASGLVLLLRRLPSSSADPVGPAAVLAVAAAGTALVALADAAARLGAAGPASLVARAGLVLGMAAVTLPPRAASWREAAATGLAVAIAAAAVVLRPPAERSRTAAAPPQAAGRRPVRRAARSRRGGVPGRLRQRLARYDSHAGIDCLRGRINVEVAAGARAAHGHVGFCPAFVATPAVEVTTDYDGVEATVAAAEVLPWGVRVEVRLAEPAEEPLEIPVDLLVRGPE